MLDITLAEKQKLLEMNGVAERLNQELVILDREIEHLKQMLGAFAKPKTQSLPWGGEISLN
jgi:hypothetical protein